MPEVSIIIVNFCSEAETERCIKSIQEHTKSGTTYEIIIISNSRLTEKQRANFSIYRDVTIIQSDVNNGFASGCNRGAREANGKYLFFLNPDSAFENDVLTNLITFYTMREEPGIVVPFVYNEQGSLSATIRNNMGILLLLTGAFPFLNVLLSKKHQSKHFKPKSTGKIDAAKGSAFFLSKKLFEQLGGMDDHFFMYWEENDIFLRAQKAGTTNYITKSSKVVHWGGISTSPHFNDMFLIMHISKKRFIKKHYPHLILVSRILSIIGYGWRTLVASLFLSTKKKEQFSTALRWYVLEFNNNAFARKLIDKYKHNQ